MELPLARLLLRFRFPLMLLILLTNSVSALKPDISSLQFSTLGGLVPALHPSTLVLPCSLSLCGDGNCTIDRTLMGGYRCSSGPGGFAVSDQPQTRTLVEDTKITSDTLNLENTVSVSCLSCFLEHREM